MDILKKIKDIYNRIKKRGIGFYDILYRFIKKFFDALMEKPRLRYLSFIWSIVIIFAGFHLLVQVNPLRLIFPGLIYSFPVFDKRQIKSIYIFSAKEMELKKIDKKIYLSDDQEKNIHNLAFIISGQFDLRDEKYDQIESEIYPNLGFAIKKIWFYNENQAGKLIVDLREKTIDEEFDIFFKDREFPAHKTKSYFLDAYFQSLTRSIFSIEDKIKLVIFLVDGKSKSLADMKFDMSLPQKSEL
jgi:hypothetical protein